MTRSAAAVRTPRRAAVLALVAVVLGAAGAVSAAAPTTPQGTGVRPDALAASSPGSSAFFCGALEHVKDVVDSTIAIANLGGSARTAEVTTTDQDGHVTTRAVRVGAGRVVHLHPGNYLPGAVEAASVLSSDGDLVVTESVQGASGTAVAPCLSRTSTSWWLSGGSTEPGQSFLVELYNPTLSRAVATVQLVTPSGPLPPPSYAGLVLGPHQVLPLVVHSVAPNESPITVEVTASDGAVVAEGLERGLRHSTSIAILPGTPAPEGDVVVPVASSRWPLRTTLGLYTTDPGGTSATVQVLPAPTRCAPSCPGPATVAVPGGGAVAEYEVPTTSVPIGEPFALVVHALGAGVLVTESVGTVGAAGASVPADDPGFVAAAHLALVDPLPGGFDEVGVVNPSGSAVRVSLETPGRGGAHAIGRSYVVAGHARLVLGPNQLAGMAEGAILELVATGPIAAAGLAHGATVGAATLVAVPVAS